MGLITASYDASFDSVSFLELLDGSNWHVEPDTGVEYSVTHIPGGSTIVVQSAGQALTTLDLPIGCDLAELTSLRSKARSATRGSLVYHAASGGTQARLMKVKQTRKAPPGDGYQAVLEFIVG